MKSIESFAALESFGRERLSSNFFMRDFLHSEIAAWHQLRNVPDFPERAIKSGQQLCATLLEPLQAAFGRIHVRSGYRSPLVNAFGNEHGMNCASNKSNFAGHIWDYPDEHGHGATACIVVPWLVDHIGKGGSWTDMAWWIHDHLDYNTLCFFPQLSAFNINWHEKPVRRIDSYSEPRGCLTRPGMSNHGGLHRDQYAGFPFVPHVPASREAAPPRSGRADSSASHALPVGHAQPANVSAEPAATINYRAVHTRTAWRKASNHASLDSAIYGKDGAAGLFARKVRIRYETHGDPMYVLVWIDGEQSGYVVKPDATAAKGIIVAPLPVAHVLEFEARRSASVSELEPYFASKFRLEN